MREIRFKMVPFSAYKHTSEEGRAEALEEHKRIMLTSRGFTKVENIRWEIVEPTDEYGTNGEAWVVFDGEKDLVVDASLSWDDLAAEAQRLHRELAAAQEAPKKVWLVVQYWTDEDQAPHESVVEIYATEEAARTRADAGTVDTPGMYRCELGVEEWEVQ